MFTTNAAGAQIVESVRAIQRWWPEHHHPGINVIS